MIDVRELRRDSDGFLAKLARMGAADLGRALLEVDATWRTAKARVEALRVQHKQQSGRPTESERLELARGKEQLQAEQIELERQRKDLLDRIPTLRPRTA
jgi:seryl-tRNA synthetase